MLERAETALLGLADKCDSRTTGTGTGSASYAVNIVLSLARHIVIDHKRYIVDVDAACDDVGGNDDVEFGGTEIVHHLVAAFLLEVAVHLADFPSLLAERFSQVLDLEFGGCEYDDFLVADGAEQVF